MAFYSNDLDIMPESYVTFETIYNKECDLGQNENLLFDFQLTYTRAPEVNSDGEEEDLENFETLTVYSSHQFEKNWLIGGDEDHIKAIVYHILDLIEVSCYTDTVDKLTDELWKLKEADAISPLHNVERIKVTMDVVAYRFPGKEDDVDVEVRFAVAPASDEAVETHLETVEVMNEEYCVICMDNIRVGSDVTSGQMPCGHMFHRMCVEEWLRNSAVCPVCRSVFPS